MPLQPTLQHVYATNLDQQLGYPLRNPQLRSPDPEKKLEEPYKSNGLQIGDIGHVDDYGAFNLLFNVKFPPKDDLGQSSELNQFPPHFDEPVASQTIQPGEVFKTGVTQILDGARTDATRKFYKFVARACKGSILILPNGATLFELENQHLTVIRNHVKKYALAWCRHAQKDTLYLITAAYRAKTWTLGSFKSGVVGEEIHVEVRAGDPPGILEYSWEHAFNVDSQQVSARNTDLNQAVFIKGFKMTVGKHQLMIEKLVKSEGWFDRLLVTLQSAAKKWRHEPKIKYFPAKLSELSHPLDVVNRILLDKNPGIPVAITHDDDWIEMMKNKLPFEKLMEKGYVRHFMDANYSCDLDTENNTVCLVRHNSEGKANYEIVAHGGRAEGTDVEFEPKPNQPLLEVPGDIEAPTDKSRLVITHMRLESFDVGNVDAGVCVFVQFGTTTRRTNNKPYASIIEWDDEITLPSDEPVHVTVHGTFQLGSTLGTREISAKKTINTGEMPESTYTVKFSFGNSEPRSSLLMTLERHFSYCETNFGCEENSEFARMTTRGFENFYSYHHENKKEHLDAALECFRSALQEDRLDSAQLISARFNIATTEFFKCQAYGTYAELDKAIESYKKALELCGEGYPDRPATVLLLAQSLLSRHGQEYDEFTVEEIEKLLEELPPDDSRNRRTADIILVSCRFYHAINAERPADVDHLLANFQNGTYTPSYGYFDRPHMSHKIGLAFWRRFRTSGNLYDLDKAIMLNTEAFLQIPDGHDDQKNIAACLGHSLLCGLEAREELRDIDTELGLTELGNKVIATLDDISFAEGTSALSQDLQKQIDLKTAVAQIREQIQLMSCVERVRLQAAADDTRQEVVERGPSSKVENPIDDWSRDEDTETECKRQLGILLSFLGGEGDSKMRKALELLNPEWPYKDHQIVATMQALEKHLPYFDTVLARRLRFIVEGWC
ncbi:hypothetical protein JVU11DRAFT_3049 [Chiua virens]|nr:hypothetical protein JVU11DRAFT_3049 [Chiua virens]